MNIFITLLVHVNKSLNRSLSVSLNYETPQTFAFDTPHWHGRCGNGVCLFAPYEDAVFMPASYLHTKRMVLPDRSDAVKLAPSANTHDLH
jgi:hypothetical protein